MKEITAKNGIMIAFGELFLKSDGVRSLFIKRLINQLKAVCRKEQIEVRLNFLRDRLFIGLEEKDLKKAMALVGRAFGISWAAETVFLPGGFCEEAAIYIEKNFANWIGGKETYALRVKVYENAGGAKREEVIEKIAEKIDRKVDLDNPKKEIFIEMRKPGAFIYFKKERAAGGLPSGSAGKALVMMSGGIDSPVAAYLSAKRGAENIWIHFHSFPVASKASLDKVGELAGIFTAYQPNLKVIFVPFGKIQSEIKASVPGEYRVLIYRRLMLKIAEKIAEEKDCLAIITGESLGQVSSQTLKNLQLISSAVKIQILRPVLAFDKEETIRLAQEIGTYNESIKPQEDCCTLFVSKHQTAQGDMDKIKEIEKNLDIKRFIREAIRGMEEKTYN